MTKEETLSNLKAYLNGDTAIGNIIPLRSVLESALKYLEPSLPSNLDEAANNYGRDIRLGYPRVMDETDRYIYNAFKAGAEWMAGQGQTIESLVWRDEDDKLFIEAFVDENEFKMADKIIIQLRKKS